MVTDVESILDTDPQTAGQTVFDLRQVADVYVYRAA